MSVGWAGATIRIAIRRHLSRCQLRFRSGDDELVGHVGAVLECHQRRVDSTQTVQIGLAAEL
jgi:hypothetical protein